ncbi:MAG TPA: LLM class flavin-dependent oxidoreductase [Anaerolineales bacterium]|nr:LLM class flavin-dependent oxidoreductase [Anaerolineales bacterium]
MKVGLVLIIAEHRELRRAYSYHKTRELAIQAEEAGFDSLWLYDHLLYRPEGQPTIGIWECWTFLSALAEATQKVELGTLVACNSFRNPALLAKMAITLDEVSNGRLILGLGAGWNKAEYDAFGYPFDHRVSRFEEALQIIRPLIKNGHVDFVGKYYTAKNCEIRPIGSRRTGPPIMIGSFGKRMLNLTARYADLWNTGYLGLVETLTRPRQELLAACQEAGRDPATLDVTAMLHVHYPRLSPLPNDLDNPPISGTPSQVARAMLAYEQAGVEHIMFHVLPYKPTAIRQLERALHLYHQLSDEKGAK